MLKMVTARIQKKEDNDNNGNQTQMQTARHEDEMLLEENAMEYNMGYNLRSRKGPLYLNSPSVEKPQIQGKKKKSKSYRL